MQQIPNYGDERTLAFCAFCAFCGGETSTRDHCPSKVLLDEPYPENLPVVPACRTCNASFSVDEEYLACLLSCVIAGTTNPESMPRKKTNRILIEKPALRARIEQARAIYDGVTTFIPEQKRVTNVLTKLAQGHALYELHESCARKPDEFSCVPLALMTAQQRETFENSECFSVWPEVGNRAMQRLAAFAGTDVTPSGWFEVQPNRYRFHASQGNSVEIRIVIHEYLACYVQWK